KLAPPPGGLAAEVGMGAGSREPGAPAGRGRGAAGGGRAREPGRGARGAGGGRGGGGGGWEGPRRGLPCGARGGGGGGAAAACGGDAAARGCFPRFGGDRPVALFLPGLVDDDELDVGLSGRLDERSHPQCALPIGKVTDFALLADEIVGELRMEWVDHPRGEL